MTPKTHRLLLAAPLLLLAPALALAQAPVDPDYALRMAHLEQVGSVLDGYQILTMRIVPLVFILILTALGLLFASRRDKQRQELLARFIDKGQEIPSALMPAPPSGQRDMRLGVWFTSLGFGFGLVLYIATGEVKVAAWCLILLFLGAASFLNAVLFHPRPGQDR